MSTPVNWNIPAVSPKANDADALGETILAKEDALLEALTAKTLGDTDTSDTPPSEQLQEPTPFDPDADRADFEQLLALIAQHKDEGTVVHALSVDAFMTGLEDPTPSLPTDEQE